MFHRIKTVVPNSDYTLKVHFLDNSIKLYDIKRYSAFKALTAHPVEFFSVTVDTGGYGIVWNDELDLSCDELWENGQLYENAT